MGKISRDPRYQGEKYAHLKVIENAGYQIICAQWSSKLEGRGVALCYPPWQSKRKYVLLYWPKVACVREELMDLLVMDGTLAELRERIVTDKDFPVVKGVVKYIDKLLAEKAA